MCTRVRQHVKSSKVCAQKASGAVRCSGEVKQLSLCSMPLMLAIPVPESIQAVCEIFCDLKVAAACAAALAVPVLEPLTPRPGLLSLFWETTGRVFMVQPGLINSPETQKNGSVVAQACCIPAVHLTLYQCVAAGLGPGHGNRRRCTLGLGLLASFVFMEGTCWRAGNAPSLYSAKIMITFCAAESAASGKDSTCQTDARQEQSETYSRRCL